MSDPQGSAITQAMGGQSIQSPKDSQDVHSKDFWYRVGTFVPCRVGVSWASRRDQGPHFTIIFDAFLLLHPGYAAEG